MALNINKSGNLWEIMEIIVKYLFKITGFKLFLGERACLLFYIYNILKVIYYLHFWQWRFWILTDNMLLNSLYCFSSVYSPNPSYIELSVRWSFFKNYLMDVIEVIGLN